MASARGEGGRGANDYYLNDEPLVHCGQAWCGIRRGEGGRGGNDYHNLIVEPRVRCLHNNNETLVNHFQGGPNFGHFFVVFLFPFIFFLILKNVLGGDFDLLIFFKNFCCKKLFDFFSSFDFFVFVFCFFFF